MKKTTYIFFLLLLGSLAACSKKSEDNQPSRSTLIVKTWLLTSAVVSPAIPYPAPPSTPILQISDLYNLALTPCDKDDWYVFKADKTIEVQEGSSASCSSTIPATQVKSTGTWSLNTDETQLNYKAGAYDFKADILEISQTQMKLRTDAQAFSSLVPASYGIAIPNGTKIDLVYTAK